MRLKLIVLLIFLPVVLKGQTILDEYIKTGVENNLSLKQKQSDYNRSLEALKEARGMFYPEVSLNARYSLSKGGRDVHHF